MMRIAFVHRRAPGQFVHLARHLVGDGWDVTFVCETMGESIPGVRVARHRAEPPARAGAAMARHLATTDQHVRIGHRVAETLEAIRREDGEPDVVVGHLGWGGLLFAKDVLPNAPALGYCEYFYRPEGGDVGYDPAEPVTADDRRRLRLLNATQLLALDAVDGGISPTRWQRSRFPSPYRRRIAVCHDGIDLDLCRPNPDARFELPDGRVLKAGAPVVTYAARDLEPYRGFPQFMRAAAEVLRRDAAAIVVVAGGDGVSYGRPPPSGGNWRSVMMAETGVDPGRIAFLGQIPHDRLVSLFQVSAAHVYLTVPFVLSWSMLEAMACGALVIGSATAPVEEVIEDGRNGLLVPFFDRDALAGRLLEALASVGRPAPIRAAARRTVAERYALPRCLERQSALLQEVIGVGRRGRLPRTAAAGQARTASV
jgi:glycosyltransferase involved in cell wall biosynthesis